jgi:LytR cell envelope-related transcriptional attenuator
MSKSWPIALAVIVVGGLAGVAIAGRPDDSDPFVLDSSVAQVTDAAPASAADSTPEATTTTTAPVPAITTTTEPTTTTTAPVADTAAPSTTEATPTTVQETTTTIGGPLPPDQFRLVIANGDGRFRLAGITADRLAPLGYDIDLGDTLQRVDATIIYYRPGFEDEAAVVAKDLKVPGAILAAFPDNATQPITNSDDSGDVIIVLGPDAPR